MSNLSPSILLSGLLAVVPAPAPSAHAADRPNIVFILADDMGYDSVSALNAQCNVPTPNIDRLIRQGMNFTDAHSPSAVCSPTRYGVLTGRYSWRTRMKRGIVGQWKPPLIKADRLTVGDMLQEVGYHTACIGKWHLGWNWSDGNGRPTTTVKRVDFKRPTTGGPVDQGFNVYFGDDVPNWPPYVFIENHQTLGIPSVPKPKNMFGSPGLMLPGWKLEAVLPAITGRSVAYIADRAKADKPFFLYFPLTSPHTPIAPSKAFKGKSGVSAYADFLMETDWSVGQIMQALENHGLSKNTLLIFTADNGTSPVCKFDDLKSKGVNLCHHFRGHKADIFEGGHRVPFVARWPGVIPAGSSSDQVICLTDFMATAAEVVGYDLPDDAAEDSRSLLPILKGGKLDRALHEAVVHHSIGGQFAVRQGRWKLQFCRGSGGWSKPREAEAAKAGLPAVQLYDLEADLKEQKNVMAEHPQVVARLTAVLRRYIDDGRSTPGKAQKNDGPAWWPQLPWPQPGSKGTGKVRPAA